VTRARPVLLSLLLVALLLPLLPLLLYAFARTYRYPALLPDGLSLRAVRLLGAPGADVLEGLATSAVIATTVAVIASAIGLSAGRALGLYRFRGRRLVQFLLLAPVIVPGLAVVLGIHVLFLRYGLADTRQGVVLVHLIPTIPYVTLVMAPTFANYDVAYEEQARVLGAGPLRVLAQVTLPQVAPGLVVAALFAFLISWSEYILTLLVGGGTVKTLPLLLFASLGSPDTSRTAVLALVIVTPPVLLLVATSKLLSGGGRSGLAGLGRI
jgi:putative spermidine/putrescine transport system permease protein